MIFACFVGIVNLQCLKIEIFLQFFDDRAKIDSFVFQKK